MDDVIYFVIITNTGEYYMNDEGFDELTKQLRFATFFDSLARARQFLNKLHKHNNFEVYPSSFTIQKVSMNTEDLFDDQEKTS